MLVAGGGDINIKLHSDAEQQPGSSGVGTLGMIRE